LEYSLNGKISVLWHLKSEVDDVTRNQTLEFLSYAKTYRRRWPRKVEVFFDADLDADLAAAIQQAANEATDILASYESESNKAA
jgi:hypothetical protein